MHGLATVTSVDSKWMSLYVAFVLLAVIGLRPHRSGNPAASFSWPVNQALELMSPELLMCSPAMSPPNGLWVTCVSI